MWQEVSGPAKSADTGTKAKATINQNAGASEGKQEIEEGESSCQAEDPAKAV